MPAPGTRDAFIIGVCVLGWRAGVLLAPRMCVCFAGYLFLGVVLFRHHGLAFLICMSKSLAFKAQLIIHGHNTPNIHISSGHNHTKHKS